MRRVFLVGLAAAAVAALLALDDLHFDHDSRSLLRADPVADAREQELQEAFGAEDILLLAWEGDALDPATFRRVAAVTAELEGLAGLEEVYGLASPVVKFSLGGRLRSIGEGDLAAPAPRAEVARALRGSAVYRGTLYNPELDVVAVASSIRLGPRAEREATLRAVEDVARRHAPPGGEVRVAGVTALAVEAASYALRDLRRIGLLALGVSVVVLLLLCRSVRETAVAIVATGLPPLLALGGAVVLEVPMTALGAALFPVLAVVGITSSVHLLNAYGEERAAGHDADAAGRRAARRLAAPILLSLGTTAAAFASLQATGVPAFRAGGHVVALGLVVAMPVVLVGLPALLAIVRPPAPPARAGRLAPLLVLSAHWVGRHPRAILGVGLALCLVGSWLATRARLQVQVLQAFAPESSIARTYRFLDERLTATVPVDAVLTARPDATDEEILADLARFTERAEAEPGVDSALSLHTLVEYGRQLVEWDPALVLGYLRTLMGSVTRRFEHRPTRRYRVKVRVREGTPPAVLDHLQAATAGFASGEATLTGLYVRAVGTTRHLVRDLARGTLLMGLVVMATVGFALRSWRLGLAALAPNLLPPAVVFGGTALLGVALDVSAVAVGAVAVGLAVDDTLHVVFRLAAERRAGRTPDEAFLATQRSVGRALVLSTVVLAAGLSCLAFSSFLPTARFGRFTAIACLVALPADLLLLPACVRALRA